MEALPSESFYSGSLLCYPLSFPIFMSKHLYLKAYLIEFMVFFRDLIKDDMHLTLVTTTCNDNLIKKE
jgi:hypothetical protein